jgi:hypothetical protein
VLQAELSSHYFWHYFDPSEVFALLYGVAAAILVA